MELKVQTMNDIEIVNWANRVFSAAQKLGLKVETEDDGYWLLNGQSYSSLRDLSTAISAINHYREASSDPREDYEGGGDTRDDVML